MSLLATAKILSMSRLSSFLVRHHARLQRARQTNRKKLIRKGTTPYENHNQIDYGPLKISGVGGIATDPSDARVPHACVLLFTERKPPSSFPKRRLMFLNLLVSTFSTFPPGLRPEYISF